MAVAPWCDRLPELGGFPKMSASVLDSSVLVLNRYYVALRVVSVRRALTLLYRECAEVIVLENEQYQYSSYDFAAWCELSQFQSEEKQPGEEYIQAVGFELQVPRIVRLTRYDRISRAGVRFNRKNLFARDNYRCQYCGQTKPTNMLSIDHVIPRSLGGRTSWENVVCSCLRCNSRKGGRTPQQAHMTLLSTPSRPKINPTLTQPIQDPRYECWKTFLPTALHAAS
jgi:5-methylcytosine-specific restriction endonuclease McrA